ncbi:MAG TPA: hypothetical protein VIF62_03965, partial [Labilithrix sp.]
IGLVAAVAAVIVLGWYAASTRASARAESTMTATPTATMTATTTTTAIASASAGDVTTPTQPAARATGAHVKHGGKGGKCDPPWILDSNGIRRYDPACM